MRVNDDDFAMNDAVRVQSHYKRYKESLALIFMLELIGIHLAQANQTHPNIQPQTHVPHLQTTRPNEVWAWNATELPTRKRGEYVSL